jgi:hypothetical protein
MQKELCIMNKKDDFQTFIAILEKFVEKPRTDDFFQKIIDLEADDYRLHYYKSEYYRKQKALDKAITEIRISINLFEHIDSHLSSTLPYENTPFLILNGHHNNAVTGKDLYFHAGELYAEANLMEESLKAYKCFHLINRVKSHHVPILYSFRTFNEYSLPDLVNKEITLVHPSEFNDPFDTLILHWTKRFDEHCTEKQHIEPYRSSFDYYRVRSFVKDTSSTKAYKNTLMWSHYADEHKGYCVKYRFDEDFASKTGLNIRFQPIIYTKRNEKINVDDNHIDTNLGYCTKQYLWKYEKEIRLIAYMPEAQSHFSPIPMGDLCRIDAIYFGTKCNGNSIKTIKNILNNTDIKYYRMHSQPQNIFNLIAKPER